MSIPHDGLRAVATTAVWVDYPGQSRIDLTGPDRAKFLHNLTTNDVKRLALGNGQESFVTSPQGKTLGYVTVLAADDRILLFTDPGALVHVLPHFRKYGVFDEVTVDDLTERTFSFHVAGPRADEILRAVGAELPEEGILKHRLTRIAEAELRIYREAPTGHPGLTLSGPHSDFEAVLAAIRAAGGAYGLEELSSENYETLRIEAGTPVFGRDVTADNLPQEVPARDDRAINFVKGCYLGQETVARIDALGHVNKLLRGLQVGGTTIPAPGSTIEAAGKTVGTVTSAAFSPSRGSAVALGYVRAAQAAAGTEVLVKSSAGNETVPARVCDLPMPNR